MCETRKIGVLLTTVFTEKNRDVGIHNGNTDIGSQQDTKFDLEYKIGFACVEFMVLKGVLKAQVSLRYL